MLSADVKNVNDAYEYLMKKVWREGVEVETRNGKAMALRSPLLVHFHNPTERVLFNAQRDANPFFHLVEAMWMLAGRNDVEFIKGFNQNMMSYSDDGLTFNAAYGHRWRKHFGYDQIDRACRVLSKNAQDRRCVIAMWDGAKDLGGEGLDFPCNTTIMCRIEGGALDFTITNRSNDLVFGLCGANAVHMTILQEYMATRIGVRVGNWFHLSNNLHIYERHYDLIHGVLDSHPVMPPRYPCQQPIMKNWTAFDRDCIAMCHGVLDFEEPFFIYTVRPMIQAWRAWKLKDLQQAMYFANDVLSEDWQKAAVEWLQRRAPQ